MTEIKQLTLWQPWASAIAHGLKRIETRHWGTQYRGWIAIHAAKRRIHRSEVRGILTTHILLTGSEEGLLVDGSLDWLTNSPQSCIVALAYLTACKDMTHPYIANLDPTEKSLGNYAPGRVAWELEQVIPLESLIEIPGSRSLCKLREPYALTLCNALIDKYAA